MFTSYIIVCLYITFNASCNLACKCYVIDDVRIGYILYPVRRNESFTLPIKKFILNFMLIPKTTIYTGSYIWLVSVLHICDRGIVSY